MPGLRDDQVALYMKDMYKAAREGYEQIPTVYDKVFKKVTGVKGAGDKHTQILGAGQLTRHTTEGQDINFKAPVQGWEYLVKYWTYSDGIVLTKEAVDDTTKLGNLLKDLANTWGISERVEKEEMAARVFNQGGALSGDWVFNGTHTGNTDSSGDLLYDGQPLFALTGNGHSTKGGSTYHNSIANLDLSPSTFEQVYNLQTSTNNIDERDRKISNPADTILTEKGSDSFLAERIVDTSKGMPGGNLNDINPYYKKVSPLSWDYLTDSAWFIGRRQDRSFQFHERQKPEIRFFRDEKNLGYKASINMRCGVLIKNWRTWTRGNGSSS